MEIAEKLLQQFSLNKTPCRVDVLRTLGNAQTALSEYEIRQQLAFSFDRATVFRTLRTFLETGLIHSIPVDTGDVRYAITHEREKQKRNYHAHFHCTNCEKVVCLKDLQFSAPKLSDEYNPNFYNLVIDGFCKHCETQKHSIK